MHEVEVKLSAMHLGGRKRVLYYAGPLVEPLKPLETFILVEIL